MSIPPSGRQYEIRHGEQVAVEVEVGGGVREYRVGERAVLDPYPLDAMCDGAHGAPLVPWPNRLADGRYRFDGVDQQVAITEPEISSAINGFLRGWSWDAVREEPNRVTMGTQLHPLTGYPFLLEVEVDYLLDDDELTYHALRTGRTQLPVWRRPASLSLTRQRRDRRCRAELHGWHSDRHRPDPSAANRGRAGGRGAFRFLRSSQFGRLADRFRLHRPGPRRGRAGVGPVGRSGGRRVDPSTARIRSSSSTPATRCARAVAASVWGPSR